VGEDEVFARLLNVLEAECPKALEDGIPGWDAHLQYDLRLDSADVIVLMAALEDEFGLRLEDQDMAHVETVGHVVELVLRAVGEGTTLQESRELQG